MLAFFRKKQLSSEELPLIKLPLINIQIIDEAGILYTNLEGCSVNIHYFEAYKGWHKSHNAKKSKIKYICDGTKSKGWQLVFYTDSKLVFYADPNQVELWTEIVNRVGLQGYAAFILD